MEDKQLNAAESIALISRMIDNTRNRMLRNSGRPFLVWGYVTVFTTLLVMGAVYYFQNPKWNILWMLLPVLGALLMWRHATSIPKAKSARSSTASSTTYGW